MIIGGVSILIRPGGVLTWTSGLAVDADGAPRAYAPPNSGLPALDALGNAGHPGHWWGIAKTALGEPIIQGSDGPAPGYYVSTTALQDSAYRESDQRRYVDASTVPYLVVPPELREIGVRLADVAQVVYGDQRVACIVGDVGPHDHLGEGSIALARALGLSPRHGTERGAVVDVTLWRGSSQGWPRPLDDIAAQVNRLRCVA